MEFAITLIVIGLVALVAGILLASYGDDTPEMLFGGLVAVVGIVMIIIGLIVVYTIQEIDIESSATLTLNLMV